MSERKLWNIVPYDKQKALSLAHSTGTDEFAALLLLSRGFNTPQKLTDFFNTSLSGLSSPYLLKDMDKAVSRIHLALERDEKICIYGDYDCDGVTATTLLYTYLSAQGADVDFYIPSRLTEGYGLTLASAEKVAQTGCSLVITVDNGIASCKEAAYFTEQGIDLIVTDHHQCGELLPNAVAVIDPHRPDDTSPYKDLCGVGVAFKLAAALQDGDYELLFEDFGDLLAIGTVADIVPLTGENRILVANGLSYIENTQRLGLVCLLKALGLQNKAVNASMVAFGIAPKINAAGRMATAADAVRLLLSEEEDEALELVERIVKANNDRQTAELKIVTEATEQIEQNPSLKYARILVVASTGWHPGVMGIAAARIMEKYGKPTVIIAVDENGVGRGSCRSMDGFCLYDALTYCKDCLIQYGGHTLAAGLSVQKESIEVFTEKINEFAAAIGEVYPTLTIDCKLNPAYLSVEILDSLHLLEPFGAENPSPLFGILGVKITEIKSIGNNKHLRLTLTKQGVSLQALYFGVTQQEFCYRTNDLVDIAVHIEKNEFRGEISLSIQIKDIRPASADDKTVFSLLKAVQSLKRGEGIGKEKARLLTPDRKLLGDVFRFIKEQGECTLSPELICYRLHLNDNLTGAVSVCLEALSEVGVLQKTPNGYADARLTSKADLSASSLLARLSNPNP